MSPSLIQGDVKDALRPGLQGLRAWKLLWLLLVCDMCCIPTVGTDRMKASRKELLCKYEKGRSG
ncbi:hypothetical protein M430DRAFT_36679 [Amorphotheca resinae ATCC 22711]|uniref:Uncharacterized protein n=1 Tax=Amorphotheca resinae ATCC 22711 TaxID=857342 RepID=A0A2T3AVA2_AMORE|nr:hypothetical protein M430DRAFT_36679 [Amorphotheca resinae ATCC 22711]PSS12595.1 hypothetical protein M430DRAFT_36679 [Amorphotheca resinae ATCC 22711]